MCVANLDTVCGLALQIARHGLSEIWPILFPEWPETTVQNVSHKDVEAGLLKVGTELSAAYAVSSEEIHKALKWELDCKFTHLSLSANASALHCVQPVQTQILRCSNFD